MLPVDGHDGRPRPRSRRAPAICCSKARPHWQAQLDDVAMRRARAAQRFGLYARRCRQAHSGVLSATRSAQRLEAVAVQESTNSWSYRSSSMMTLSMAMARRGVGAGPQSGSHCLAREAPPPGQCADRLTTDLRAHAARTVYQPMAEKAVGVGLDRAGCPTPGRRRAPASRRFSVAVGVGLQRAFDDDHVAVLGGRADHAGQVAGEAGEAERGDVGRLHAGGGEVGDLPADVAAGAVHERRWIRTRAPP